VLSVIYAGSPDISATVLHYLATTASIKIVGVLTNPPSAKGRHKALIPTPVAKIAKELNIPVFEPEHLKIESREVISALHPDILVCFSYGKIFGPKFMAMFPKGGINLHPSLLPRWRGCAPVSAAILAQDTETGITVQRLAQKMDTGDILMQKIIPLKGDETAAALLQLTAEEGGSMLAEVLCQIDSGKEHAVKQGDRGVSYSELLKKEDGAIDWNENATSISAKIRAFNPWPGAFTCVDGKMLRILDAAVYSKSICGVSDENLLKKSIPGTVLCADKIQGILIQCGEGILVAKKLQWQSKNAMDWKIFLNGVRNFTGTCCCKIDKG
jgi:methionyl-tRNA formyltransferase